ncbi:PAS domain-containing hybrid sensor histidine kinase/response regulator [Roseateles toxinivorans]|uniref:Sensory/regulatory protein RpfC n=1 Tax=Roseateles toxinivorans TaxID=270368 RepID=A0A4R6QH50_9BURK|nr:PAS domain-containing hybrid sensor histidine kinase/response regulator [Roseateles toxinivorans]TDP62023.1 two-component system sensor histidine kinase/response regulator FitF [Roseateles toxinivorans]
MEHLASDLDLLPCAVLVTDGQGQALLTNAELHEQFGMAPPSGVQWHLDDLLPPASRIFMQTHVWPLLLRQGRVDEIHLKLRSANGKQRAVLLNARCDPGKAPPASLRVHWAFFVATERQRFEAELLQARQRLQNLLLSSNAGTWEWHVPSGALKVNERWAEMLGWPIADITPPDLGLRTARLHPDERERITAQLEVLQSGTQAEYLSEHRMQHRQGHWVWVQERGRVISRMPDGSAEWVFGTLVDISGNMAQRTALRRSEALLGRTNELAGVGGWELDLLTQTLFWSAQTCRLHGVAVDYQPKLDESLDFYPPAARQQIEAALRRGMEEGIGWDLEVPFVRRDGTPLVVRALGMVDREEGRPVRLMGALQDVTEQHHLMQALLQAKLDAEAASEAKSMFLANMSHEIRTPMNAIIGIGHLLSDTPLNEDQSQLLGKLQISGRSLLSLIDDVLDLAKIEAGEMTAERAAYSPHDVLQELDAVFAIQAGSKGLNWTLSKDPQLPQWLIGDASRVRQVLSNLLSNALKFTQAGGVSLIARVDGAQLRFSVRDSGIGISTESQSKLFQPFVQADASTTRRFGGTGLGLFISKRLVVLMGGSLTLHSAAAEGAEFIVTLPLEPADAAALDQVLHRPIDDSAQAVDGKRLQGLRVLVVDDSEINLDVVKRMLEQEGAEAVCETRAALAITRLQRGERYDALLMDIQMPEMDGLEATRRIRQLAGLERLPVLALTAGALSEERRRALEAGMDDFLTKPLDPGKLVYTLSRRMLAHTAGLGISAVPASSSPPPANYPVIDGVNMAEALPRLGGDLALFQRMVVRMLATFDSRWVEELHTLDAARLKATLHKLRGSAATLGAARIDQLATQAEDRLRQGGQPDEIQPQLNALAEALDMLRQSAAGLLVTPSARSAPPTQPALQPPGDAAQRFTGLLTLLRQQDLGAATELEFLLPWLRQMGLPDEELQRLQHDVAELDFEPVLQFLCAWQASGAAAH